MINRQTKNKVQKNYRSTDNGKINLPARGQTWEKNKKNLLELLKDNHNLHPKVFTASLIQSVAIIYWIESCKHF